MRSQHNINYRKLEKEDSHMQKVKELINKILSFIRNILNKLQYNQNSTLDNIKSYDYSIKNIMTDYERYFYNILLELENECNIKIHPQLNLSSVIQKDTNTKYQNELFRNIDFAIFTSDYSTLLLLIEVNDATHNTKRRRNRDNKVDIICKNANIKLIKFYSNMPNHKKYIKDRIINELNQK